MSTTTIGTPSKEGEDVGPTSWREGSLWRQIQSHLRPAEVEPVRRAIGLAVVEHNEDLIREIEALQEILNDFQQAPSTNQVQTHQ